ncbi:MAG: MBL fold metallo-hydrolase [Nanoarchaeota archaeon]|nr:MBL fold metallo-hydrolase [Nanoarchaeota archaeon]
MEIVAVGGYSEIGKNMTLVVSNGEAVIVDMGIHLENYIQMKGDEDIELYSEDELIKAGAVPDDTKIAEFVEKVVAIVPSHAHLDHIGAIPYLAKKYKAPIVSTPFTIAVIKAILADKGIELPNPLVAIPENKKITLSKHFALELINVTHSTPQSSIVVLHTPEGQFAYTNDFKLDKTPTLGERTNYARLKEIGDLGHLKALVVDSLYSDTPGRTLSEAGARKKVEEALDAARDSNAILFTTFSSHIARLRAAIEIAHDIGRKPVLLGRSLARYVAAAEEVGIVKFSTNAQVTGFKDKMAKLLKDIQHDKKDYLLIVTGHQGEPDSVLSRIADGSLPLKLGEGDSVIFSCNVIPSDINRANRDAIEAKLTSLGVNLFKDVHASGHASIEDHKEMIQLLRPQVVIPGHVPPERAKDMEKIACELGYEKRKGVHILEDGKRVEV